MGPDIEVIFRDALFKRYDTDKKVLILIEQDENTISEIIGTSESKQKTVRQ